MLLRLFSTVKVDLITVLKPDYVVILVGIAQLRIFYFKYENRIASVAPIGNATTDEC